MKRIVLTGGGTGGHVTPHLALLPYLKGYEIHYIGTNGIEKEIMSKHPEVIFHTISATKLERRLTLKNLMLPYYLIKSKCQSKKLLKQINPQIVFSKGGYVSVPVALAAHRLKIPIISHESDMTMGLANKIIYRVSEVMCTSFEKTAVGRKKCVYTGSPVRKGLFNGDVTKGKAITNFHTSKPTIIFIGGSTGAKVINDLIYENIDQLISRYNIIHITGKNKGRNDITRSGYYQIEFTNEIEHLLAISDLAVGRAGSNAINELLAIHKPMLLIPLPQGASRGDQVDNAKEFELKGYANVLQQEDLTITTLLSKINETLNNRNKYIETMSKNSLKNGSYEIFKIIEKHSKKD